MRRLFYCDSVGTIGSVALLVLRLVVGLAFVFHGWPKIQSATNWMGPPEVMPEMVQALVAFAEFGGGIALVLGLLTRLASIGIITVMIGAIVKVHLPKGDPFVNPGGSSYELAAVYLACGILFLVLGPGRLSLDAWLFGGICVAEPGTVPPRTRDV